MFAMMDGEEGFNDASAGLDAPDFVSCNNYNPFKTYQAWTGISYPGVTINTLQHGKLINVVYCDAHVATLKLVDTFNPKISASHWNFDNQVHEELWQYPPP